MTYQPAKVSAADRALAKEICDYGYCGTYSFVAELIAKHMAAERERAQRLESCLRELLDNGAFPTAAEDRARAALEK